LRPGADPKTWEEAIKCPKCSTELQWASSSSTRLDTRLITSIIGHIRFPQASIHSSNSAVHPSDPHLPPSLLSIYRLQATNTTYDSDILMPAHGLSLRPCILVLLFFYCFSCSQSIFRTPGSIQPWR
jgi:hypothetical protein